MSHREQPGVHPLTWGTFAYVRCEFAAGIGSLILR
jgi:hypothetical protein